MVDVPRGFERYDIRGGIYRTGTTPPAIGLLIADYGLKAGRESAFYKWSNFESPPAERVALQVEAWNPPVMVAKPKDLHLPLSLDQPSWFRGRSKTGARGYRWGFFTMKGQPYEVFFWSGPDAPSRDRAAVLRALSSVGPA